VGSRLLLDWPPRGCLVGIEKNDNDPPPKVPPFRITPSAARPLSGMTPRSVSHSSGSLPGAIGCLTLDANEPIWSRQGPAEEEGEGDTEKTWRRRKNCESRISAFISRTKLSPPAF